MPAIGARSTCSKARSARWSGCRRAPRSASRQAAASSTGSRAPNTGRQLLEGRRQPGLQRAAEVRRQRRGRAVSASQPSISGSRRRTSGVHGLQQQALAHAVGRDDDPLDAQPLDQRAPAPRRRRAGSRPASWTGPAIRSSERLRLARRRSGRRPGRRRGSSRTGGRRAADSRPAPCAGAPGCARRRRPRGNAGLAKRLAMRAPARSSISRRVRSTSSGLRRAQGEGAQRQGGAVVRAPAVQADQLQAGAAQVADHALGVRLRRQTTPRAA